MKTLADLLIFAVVCALISLSSWLGYNEGLSEHANDYAAGYQAGALSCPPAHRKISLWRELFEEKP